MTGLALHHNPAELFRFLVDRVKKEPGKKLILVRSQATQRFLSRELQNELHFFAPKIETMESWLDDLATLSISRDDRPRLILSPDERVLVLEDWLRNHANQAYRKFAGPQSVQAISNIIADLRRADIALDQLSKEIDEKSFSGIPHFALLLKDYQTFLDENKWEDREKLPTLLKSINPELFPQDEIILYELNYIFEGQKKGIETVIKFCNSVIDKKITLVQYIPCSVDQEDLTMQLISWFKNKSWNLEYYLQERIQPTPYVSLLDNRITKRPLYTTNWHDPRTELDQTMRQICRSIDQAEAGEHGSECGHYIILAGDISRYESIAEQLARQYGLPVYCSRGPSLISHPVVRRLLKLLQLIPQGFQIDDVYQIFADNQIRLPKLDQHVDSTPNIRSFSQFCRRYNLRTLDEAKDQLSSIFEAERTYSIQRSTENSNFNLERSLKHLDSNLEFYQNVIKHLEGFRDKFVTKGIHPLRYWIEHARSLLSMPENLFSSEANVVRSKMVDTLTEIHETHERLGLCPEMDHNGFIDILELSLEKQREKPEEKPQGILLTQAGYFSDTFGKTVFLLGLNEGGFPSVDTMDYLQFRYEEKLAGMLYQARPDRYLEARLELTRQLAGAERLYVSRPAYINQKKVIGSSIWQDLELEIQDTESGNTTWPEEPEEMILCQADRDHHKARYTAVTTDKLFIKENAAHTELISAITNDREHTPSMGIYDGVLKSDMHSSLDGIITRQIEQWWRNHTYKGYVQTSISQLDEYAASPMDYFFKRVLRLTPVELYQDEAESEIKGSLLHEILEAFYTPDSPFVREHTGLVWPADDKEKALLRIQHITENVLETYKNQLGYKDSPFPAILKNNIKRVTAWFIEHETKLYEQFADEINTLRPATFFAHPSFKMEYQWELHRDYGDINARITGKIDRIDIDEKGELAVVYDYKSGSSGLKAFHKTINLGQSFQLPIYGLAILDKEIQSFAAGYYSLPMGKTKGDVVIKYEMGSKPLFDESFFKKKKKNTCMGMMKDEELRHFLKRLESSRLLWILRNIKKGVFNTSLNDQSGYSDYKWISRYNTKIQRERAHVEEQNREKLTGDQQLYRYYAPLNILDSE